MADRFDRHSTGRNVSHARGYAESAGSSHTSPLGPRMFDQFLHRFGGRHPLALIASAVTAGLILRRLARRTPRDTADRFGDASAGSRGPARAHTPSGARRNSDFATGRSGWRRRQPAADAAAAALDHGRAGADGISGLKSLPSSATDVSVSTSDYGGSGEPGAISTGST